MGTRVDKLRGEHGRLLRLAFVGSVVGGGFVYSLLIAAKLVWGLPEYSWRHVVLTPPIGFGLFMAGLWFASRQDIRKAKRFEDLA